MRKKAKTRKRPLKKRASKNKKEQIKSFEEDDEFNDFMSDYIPDDVGDRE